MHIFISIMPMSSLNPMFDHLLESLHPDDSNKWSNIRLSEEIKQVELIEVHSTHLIWSSVLSPEILQMTRKMSTLKSQLVISEVYSR